MLTRTVAALAAVLLTCAPAAAQLDTRTIPQAQPLTGTERMPAVQGSGCTAKTTPCASVAVTPSLISTFLAPVFQPLDTDLTAIAALTTADFGRQLLTRADAASARTALGLATVASSGLDTALVGVAWTAYTPTASATSGTLTTASAAGRYKRIGKTVCFWTRVSITTNGSATGGVMATLPFAAVTTATGDSQIVVGRETAAVGSSLTGTIKSGASTVEIVRYDNTYPGADGRVIQVSGCYEAA